MLVAQYAAELSGRRASTRRWRSWPGSATRRATWRSVTTSRTTTGARWFSPRTTPPHKVAERYPAVCAMELTLFREVLGPEVEVTRVLHTMAGDAVCAYRIRARTSDQRRRHGSATKEYGSP